MCAEVILSDGTVLWNLGDLREHGATVTDDDLVGPQYGPGVTLKDCFCCADPEPVMTRSGWQWSYDDVLQIYTVAGAPDDGS